MSQLKTEVANSENDIFDMQGKLEKLGRATDISAEGPDSSSTTHKAQAIRELDENMNALEEDKVRIQGEIRELDNEMAQTMEAIKTLGLVTLELEAELEQSWDIVRKAGAEVEHDRQAVTQENVTAFMSSIEVKVAELLIETGN